MSIFDPGNNYVKITAFYALSLSEYHMHIHTHPSCEIMYVTTGSCYVYVNQEEYRLENHQFIFLDAHVPHRLYVPRGSSCGLLNLEFRCQESETKLNLKELERESSLYADFCRMQKPYMTGNDTRNLGYSLKDLITQLGQGITFTGRQTTLQENNFQDYDYLIRLLFFRTLMELSGCLSGNTAAAGLLYLKKACNYISSHLTEEIRVPELAACAGINKSYLQALFSRHMHCTITDYVNKKRLEHAAFLLINSSLSITDIAFHAGYNSRQHFGSTFEKYYGMSPRAYRQLHGKRINTSTGADQIFIKEDGNWHKEPLTAQEEESPGEIPLL